MQLDYVILAFLYIIPEKQIWLSVTTMIASKKVRRETLDEFLMEKLKNKLHHFEKKFKNAIFQKEEKIRNLRLEKNAYRVMGENKEFEINELKLKNQKITEKFDQSMKLLKKERLSNEYLNKQIDSLKEKNWDQQIIDEIEELVAERTAEEAAPEIFQNNDVSDLAITRVHSELQSDDEDEYSHHQDFPTRGGTRNPESEPSRYQSDLNDLLNEDDEAIGEEDVEAIDVEDDDAVDQAEEDVFTLQETESSSSLMLVNDDELEEDEPLHDDTDDLLEDTFAACGEDEMEIADSTDIIEENTSAGELSREELFGEDIDTPNNSEDALDDVGNISDDESQLEEKPTEVPEEASSSERKEEASEPESERVLAPESCTALVLSVPSESVGRNRNRNKTRKRRMACGQCAPCLREDCGVCSNCLDKPKFGGLNKKKQKCMLKKCQNLSS